MSRRMQRGSSLSLLLALLAPSMCMAFSASGGLQSGYLHLSSINRIGLRQRLGADVLSPSCFQTRANKARLCAISCRVSAPTDASPSQESMGGALANMQEIFPMATGQELRRFLNKQKGDVAKASTMYERYLAWREASLPMMEEETADVPEWLWFHGRAKDGTKLLFVQGAMHDMTRATPEQFTLHTAQKMLELGDDSEAKVTVLVDVRAQDGLANPPAIKLLPYLRQVAPLMNDFFPGRLKRLVVYGVPRTAAALWGVVRAFLSSSTAAKVTLVAGSDRAGSPCPAEVGEHVAFEELRPDVQETHTSLRGL